MNSNEEPSEIVDAEGRRSGFSVSVTFIDVLFAVVISLGLTRIMTRPWFNDTSWNIVPAYVFEVFVILLGYSTLLLSWWGYHQSIQRRQIQGDSWAGKLSFTVDILILVGYWLLLVKFESFFFVLSVLVIIYFMYFCWDCLQSLQNQETMARQWRRRAVTILWASILVVIFAAYVVLGLHDPHLTPGDWIFVVLAHLVNILYRFNKEHLFPKLLLDLLVLKRGHEEVYR